MTGGMGAFPRSTGKAEVTWRAQLLPSDAKASAQPSWLEAAEVQRQFHTSSPEGDCCTQYANLYSTEHFQSYHQFSHFLEGKTSIFSFISQQNCCRGRNFSSSHHQPYFLVHLSLLFLLPTQTPFQLFNSFFFFFFLLLLTTFVCCFPTAPTDMQR